jgi:predicted lipid-binding transport protein (Tim44 family)
VAQGLSAYIDIIIYAAVSFILFFVLFGVLGKRTGFEKAPENEDVIEDIDENNVHPLPLPEPSYYKKTNDLIESKIEELQLIDPSFTRIQFLKGAEKAFHMIVEAFANADKETLEQLLVPKLYKTFAKSIDERLLRNEILETTIEKILSLDIQEVTIEGDEAIFKVLFHSEQTNIMYDAEKKVISGDPDRYIRLKDTWVFKHNMKSESPIWYLVETQSEEA